MAAVQKICGNLSSLLGPPVNGAQEKTFIKTTINNSDRLVFTHFICLILLISPLKYASEACKHKRMNIYESSQRNNQSLPYISNTREQLYMCGNMCMCDPRLHNLVLIQQSLTFFVIHHSAW